MSDELQDLERASGPVQVITVLEEVGVRGVPGGRALNLNGQLAATFPKRGLSRLEFGVEQCGRLFGDQGRPGDLVFGCLGGLVFGGQKGLGRPRLNADVLKTLVAVEVDVHRALTV